jgi:hypothetical protein
LGALDYCGTTIVAHHAAGPLSQAIKNNSLTYHQFISIIQFRVIEEGHNFLKLNPLGASKLK